MTDIGKTIERLSLLMERLKLQKDILGYGSHIEDLSSAIALMKEQEAKERCLKTKCIICPHCDNCDVDENGLLKKQEAVEPIWSCGKPFCGACGLRIHGGKFCSKCGKPILWKGR